MATHSSTLAWKIPWMEEPGRLQSMGSQRVGHDGETSLSLYFMFKVYMYICTCTCMYKKHTHIHGTNTYNTPVFILFIY